MSHPILLLFLFLFFFSYLHFVEAQRKIAGINGVGRYVGDRYIR